MKAYDIIEIEKEYKYIVFATSYENPIDELDTIENDLRTKNYSGKILFDLLLCNGMNSNRYIEMNFDGEYFDIFSSKVLKTLAKSIEISMYKYLKSKPSLVENSVLPKAQRYLIEEGLLYQ